MDFGISITTMVLVFFVVLIITLVNRKNTKQKKQFLKALYDLAENKGFKISEQELSRTTAIGIDRNNHRLFFIRKIGDGEVINEINLSEIRKCRIINTSRTVGSGEASQKVIEKLELAFTYRDDKMPETFLNFYNTDYDRLTLFGELQFIERWSKIVDVAIAE